MSVGLESGHPLRHSVLSVLPKRTIGLFRNVPQVLFDLLCRIGTRRLISWVADAPAEVVDGGFEQHFTEFEVPTSRTHGSAERALDA